MYGLTVSTALKHAVLITYSDAGPGVQVSHTASSARQIDIMPGSSKDDIKRSTVMLLRNLVALSQTLNPVSGTLRVRLAHLLMQSPIRQSRADDEVALL